MANDVVKAVKPNEDPKDDLINEKAFAEAAKAFHRLRGSAIACLRAAISVYRSAEGFYNISAYDNLVFSTADTNKGKDTALVISGFDNVTQIEAFIMDVIHAPCK